MLKKSVIIAGRHNTSVSLEKEFMDELLCIAKKENLSINELVTRVDATRRNENLSSALRIFILNYVKNNAS